MTENKCGSRFESSRLRAWIGFVSMLLICWQPSTAAERSFIFAGETLTTAFQELERRGLRLVYSTRVVRPDMRVGSEPKATTAREILDEILVPHDLAVQPLEENLLVVVPATGNPAAAMGSLAGLMVDGEGAPQAGVQVLLEGTTWSTVSDTAGRFLFPSLPAGDYLVQAGVPGTTVARAGATVVGGERSEVELRIYAVADALEEIEVAASYRLYRDEPISRVTLNRAEILRLPHFGDDLFRTVSFLPGISSSDLSSRFQLRGGLYREILVQLDGMELVEPFHLKDIQGLFSIIDPEIIGGLDLIPSGFAVEYGDRLGGVLEMISVPPNMPWHLGLGVDLTNARVAGVVPFAGERGRLMATLRRGWIDLVLVHLANEEEEFDVLYWDHFGRLDYDLQTGDTLSFKMLLGNDRLTLLSTAPPDLTDADTTWRNAYLWATHGMLLGKRLHALSLLSGNLLDRDRDIAADGRDGVGEVLDRRRLEVLGLKQDWNFQPGDRHFLKWGFEARRYEVDFNYRNRLAISSPIAFVRFLPAQGATTFQGEFVGEHGALYFADRVRLTPAVTVEAGLRYDHQSLKDDDQLSPRVNLVFDLKRFGALRLGWGTFHQSQRPHELEVQDGETEFSDAERAEHWTASWEKELRFGLKLRLDSYQRWVSDPRPRFENLFDPWGPVLEGQADRIRVAAESSLAEGFEVSLTHRGWKQFDGRVSYTLSSTTDRIDGRDQPRFFDQRHAVTASLNYRPGRHWNLSLVGVWHSGWPTTEVRPSLDEGGDLAIETGPYYAENHPAYKRLDLRVSRTDTYPRAKITYYLDIQNFDEDVNVRGYSIHEDSFVVQSNGQVLFLPEVETWSGTIPSFGVQVSF